MTPYTQTMQRLLDAVEAGETPNDDLIIAALGHRRIAGGWYVPRLVKWIMDPADIRAMGAAKALHEALLPGWAIERMSWWPGGHWTFHLWGTGDPDHNGDRWHTHTDGRVEASDTDPARAWLIALIRAVMAGER